VRLAPVADSTLGAYQHRRTTSRARRKFHDSIPGEVPHAVWNRVAAESPSIDRVRPASTASSHRRRCAAGRHQVRLA